MKMFDTSMQYGAQDGHIQDLGAQDLSAQQNYSSGTIASIALAGADQHVQR